MSDELKACPFCGEGDPEFYDKQNFDDEWIAYLTCQGCGADLMATGKTEMDAIAYVYEKWNARAERTCLVERVIDNGPYMEDFVVELSCGHVDNGDIPEYCRECGAKVVG